MSDEFDVDIDMLVRHSHRVEVVASDIATAQNAAATTSLSGGAFGLMCAFLPLAISNTDTSARSAINAAQSTARTVAAEVRAMAVAYQDADRSVAETMRVLHRALP
ncbi:type VII secretion target [Cellulomonas sp. NPDC089187]|uniref:type VII secretion target n=1 Tax=Cellulomonas sp. NPDC089187 TaxID=3154970 RepID=UPI0034135F67